MKRLATTAWKILRSPFAWLGPEAANSGKSVFWRTRFLLQAGILIANFAGAVVVFVCAAWVVPTPDVEDSTKAILENLVLFGVYVAVALVVGVLWGSRRLRLMRGFLTEDRDPDKDEQKLVLRGPLRIATVAAALWAGAVPVFVALNLTIDPMLALAVGITVALGGATTTAVAYLISERLLRAATARALAADPPARPLVPGVIFRSLLAFGLGTGVPVLGLLIVAIFALAMGDDISQTRLAITILGLGGVALTVGLLMTVLAARAASDPVMSVREAVSKVEEGDLDVEVPIYDGSEVGLLQASFNHMVEGLRDRRRIREAFGAYVDHEVAEHILEEGVSLEGEEVEVTLLFLDVRDFTSFAEKVDAGEVVETLNRLFECVVPIIHDHKGHVDKFVGDGLLGVFGAPRREEDHADQAVAAALEIAKAVNGDAELGVGIGIGLNSGTVVAGNVGGAGRFEFSVIGDAVNVAARIESATRETGDTILVSEHTADALKKDVKLEERDDVELKGKSEGVRVLAATVEE